MSALSYCLRSCSNCFPCRVALGRDWLGGVTVHCLAPSGLDLRGGSPGKGITAVLSLFPPVCREPAQLPLTLVFFLSLTYFFLCRRCSKTSLNHSQGLHGVGNPFCPDPSATGAWLIHVQQFWWKDHFFSNVLLPEQVQNYICLIRFQSLKTYERLSLCELNETIAALKKETGFVHSSPALSTTKSV